MPLLNHRRIYSTNSVCSEMYVLTERERERERARESERESECDN